MKNILAKTGKKDKVEQPVITPVANLNTKKKNRALSFEGEQNKVTIKFNHESEYKVGLFFKTELNGKKAPDPASLDEVRIASVGSEIWNAYREKRYEYEAQEGLAPPMVTLANGAQIPSYHAETSKERRIRPFFIMAADHPGDLEIRQEIKGGKKTTMIKIGNGASDDQPVINREEIIITSHVDENIGTLLNGLLHADLDKETREAITRAFNGQSSFVPALQSQTIRDKSDNVRAFYTDADGKDYIVSFEPSYDLGSGTTMAGQLWPIREFEGEVKAIYEKGRDINVKENPKEAGLNADDIRRISADFLQKERTCFMEFCENWLHIKAQGNKARYGDITVKPVYKSKSRPGHNMLEPFLKRGGAAMEKAIAHNQAHGFEVHPNLRAAIV